MIDAIYRAAYRLAYQGARIYWRLFRPDNNGALVAIWHQGRVLLIKNSYVKHYSLPGGNVRSGETALMAAIRELKEEINLSIAGARLKVALDHEHIWEGRLDHVVIFELDLDHEPTIQVDNREVVSAEWLRPEQALELHLFPPLRQVILERMQNASQPAGI